MDAGVNQKRAEDIHNPRKLLDQRRARKNHHAPHYERAEDPPLQHAMLESFVDCERTKDHEEQKQVVYTKCLLDQITRKKLNTTLRPRKMPDAESKQHRQRDPRNR